MKRQVANREDGTSSHKPLPSLLTRMPNGWLYVRGDPDRSGITSRMEEWDKMKKTDKSIPLENWSSLLRNRRLKVVKTGP